MKHKIRNECLICKNKNLHKFLELGNMPLPNKFIDKEEFNNEEFYPLNVYVCDKCFLVQLKDIIDPKLLFDDYLYMTGTSKPLVDHLKTLAKDSLKYHKDGLVIDIGCNDGTLLKHYKKLNFNTIGIDPAKKITDIGKKEGLNIINDYFSSKCVKKILEMYGKANIITATNVFAHTEDIKTIIEGVRDLLTEDGVFIIEVHHLMNLILNNEFDTIYHEHISYFSLSSLIHLFNLYDMTIIDVREISNHGGSLRVFIKKTGTPSDNVFKIIDKEKELGLYSLDTYNNFSEKVNDIKDELIDTLKNLKENGNRITGYGATAKGNILLNYCNIGPDILDYISDRTPFKCGKYSPGMHIPIISEDKFHDDNPDYVLLLAWNYKDNILIKEDKFRKNGGKFIIPIPKPEIL